MLECKIYITCLLSLLVVGATAQQHPVAYGTKADFAVIKAGINQYPLLTASFKQIQQQVDAFVGKDVDVPTPKDAAGGYTHEKHKANYTLMFQAGLMYQLTGQTKYAQLVKNIFLKYAALNPTLSNHPQATNNLPGRIFWQALNDANWLVYTGLAFDCIHDYLTLAERALIADGAFKPEVDFFTSGLKNWFNLIHNHAVWSCAGVGIVGMATDNANYVAMALLGSDKKGVSGFLANINGLFSPDGYYTEGPYYLRYALLPFYLFANALQNYQPGLHVFGIKDSVLKKGLIGLLQQTDQNGGFYAYNDALKEKTVVTNEIVEALGIAWHAYGPNNSLLPIALKQNRVTLTRGGAAIAKAVVLHPKQVPTIFPYRSAEFTDGANGNEGGVTIMRMGEAANQAALVFKYTAHGLSHGHFDKLNINLYDGKREILQDYGTVRYIGIEHKWGGRYLPETKTYAAQTIAHNTLVADEKSHYNANEAVAEKLHASQFFSQISGRKLQVVSAIDSGAYSGIYMHRTVYMLQLPNRQKPIVVDVFRALSATKHQYDLPFQYLGTLMHTNFNYKAFVNTQTTFGNQNGYQFLWKEAEATIAKPLIQFTFLNTQSFYTISSLNADSTQVFFTRIGANDPDFNLRRDPAYVLRKNGANATFVNVVEMHGNFDPIGELSSDMYTSVKDITLLQDDANYTVVKININQLPLVVIQCNKKLNNTAMHNVSVAQESISFSGYAAVFYNGKQILN